MNSQFLHLAFVVRREPSRTLLVDELDHASEALIRWGIDWDRQDLLSTQTTALVPGTVECEIAMEVREFLLVIRIGYIEAATMPCDKPDNTLIITAIFRWVRPDSRNAETSREYRAW